LKSFGPLSRLTVCSYGFSAALIAVSRACVAAFATLLTLPAQATLQSPSLYAYMPVLAGPNAANLSKPFRFRPRETDLVLSSWLR
jgi:hypothetical protein